MRQKVVFLSVILTIACDAVQADGLIRGGHPFGPYTTIRLTQSQSRRLSKGGQQIQLTKNQHELICFATGTKGPRTLNIFGADYQGCACELRNVGVRVAPSKVEVSHLLYDGKMFRESDSRTDSHWQEKRRIEKSREDAELARQNPPPEVRAFAEGVRLGREGDYVAAWDHYSESYRINPKYVPARRKKTEVLSGLAWNALVDHEDDAALIVRYREIFRVADPEDTDALDGVRNLIAEAERRIDARKLESQGR